MTTTLALPEQLFTELCTAAQRREESAFVGEVRLVEADQGDPRRTVLLRSLLPVPEEDYVERASTHLIIGSNGFMPSFGAIARAGSAISFVHTHPGGLLAHSKLDLAVDADLSNVAHLRTDGGAYMSLIVAGGDFPRLIARVIEANGQVDDVTRFRIVGQAIGIQAPSDEAASDVFDRQVRAFGQAGQQTLSSLRVGVVGVGGTGSAVVEQLARLGVGELVVVDDDVVEPSNLARIYGSTTSDIARTKVSVVAAHAERIGLGTQVHQVDGNVTSDAVARRLRHCDVIFGCTDDQAGRGVIARLAYWYLIPTFDLGVVVGSAAGRVTEVVGRVTYLSVGFPCLLCRRRISPEAIAAESMSSEERTRLAAEGYVAGLGEAAPSVVTLTSLVASTATTEMLHRLFDIGISQAPSELLLRVDKREVRTTTVEAVEGHFCIDPSKWAQGDGEPFLGQLWATRTP